MTDQVGAPCDDGDPNTFDEVYSGNCDCGPQPDGIQTVDGDDMAIDVSGQVDAAQPTGDSVDLAFRLPTQKYRLFS